MRSFRISLFYRLFLVFGLTFILMSAVIALSFSEIASNTAPTNLYFSPAARELSRELGTDPKPEALSEMERRYHVKIEPRHSAAKPGFTFVMIPRGVSAEDLVTSPLFYLVITFCLF